MTQTPLFDGLELMVRFYYNNNCLRQVTIRSGVHQSVLKDWMEGKAVLSEEDRQKLIKAVGKVRPK